MSGSTTSRCIVNSACKTHTDEISVVPATATKYQELVSDQTLDQLLELFQRLESRSLWRSMCLLTSH